MSTNTENTTITTNNRTFITQLDASTVASVALDGHVSFNASRLRKVEKNVVVVKEQNGKQKVAIISGGGSGHEPAMAGFVGEGFLHASVCGDVFASPSVEQIMACIDDVLVHASEEKEGIDSILLLVMNYTGDVVNFSIARDRARKEYAKSKLKNIEVFAFDDDCSIPECERGKGGARGLCGTLLGLKATKRFRREEGRGFRRCEKSPRDFGRTRRRTGFRWGGATCLDRGNKETWRYRTGW